MTLHGALSLSEAARVCGVARSTLQRRKVELIAAGALQVRGRWEIPLSALVTLGYVPQDATGDATPGATGGLPHATGSTAPAAAGDLVAVLRAQVEDLQRRLDESEGERRALTEQKDRALWAAVEASRLIEAGPAASVVADEDGKTPPVARKRRFWRWLR